MYSSAYCKTPNLVTLQLVTVDPVAHVSSDPLVSCPSGASASAAASFRMQVCDVYHVGWGWPCRRALFCVVFQHFVFSFPHEPLHSVCLVLIERVLGSVLGGEVNLGGMGVCGVWSFVAPVTGHKSYVKTWGLPGPQPQGERGGECECVPACECVRVRV